ncbi:MAG: polymerase I protein [Candidatus Curtissbacteria bacterium GW2011_GWC1_44_33]|uniref:Polymerase I protein n=1 Tax=Candidatus Curtissbacteria bacterium GW2011_GWC1_44_33 TaxID=1618413 RepID=A0A0G1J2I2_9BACT|nr:MAG: polymerase I protein [Candidatus Curtissbacteria bacterium GW2011_GWC1_44_33]
MNKLVLIDGNAILHRAFHALPPLTTKRGEPINAVYGLISMLLKVIQDLKPTHIAVAFDEKEPTFRHKEFAPYQAQRPAMAEELSGQFEKAKRVIEAFKIPIYSKVGFEADDVISAKLMGEEEVKEKLGIAPKQVADYKALVGDPSDNYPGVAGIGPKTAISLLEKYINLDGIYAHLEEISPLVRGKLVKGKDAAKLSLRLATIVRDVTVKLDIEACGRWDIDSQAVLNLFSKFGFKTLTERVKKVGKSLDDEKQMSLL